jgi:Multicopper oxidase
MVKASIRDEFCPDRLSRRELVFGAGAAGLAASMGHAQAAEPAVDYTIRIGLVSLELAPGKTIKTTGYNGSVPGPILRLREGRPVNIKVINDAGYPDLVHWHGLYLPALQDGATEEGSPIIPVGQSLLYSYMPKPAGTRWYHSHAMAMTDLTRSTYSGEFGFLIVEPAAGERGRYDREVLLAARRWEGMWVSMQDLRKGPPPDNGLEVMYHAATLGQRMLGHERCATARPRTGRLIRSRCCGPISTTSPTTMRLPSRPSLRPDRGRCITPSRRS